MSEVASADVVAETRSRFRRETPARYSWRRHIALIAAFVGGALLLVASRLDGWHRHDALALAAILLFLNFGEYAAHRWTLHRPAIPRAVYYRHVVEHHAFFTYERSAIDSWLDLRWVLFPWWALPLLVATVLPLAWLLSLLSVQLAWLFLLAVTLYYGIYEVLHTLAHLPEQHRWARQPALRALTRHHRVHHDPRLMRRYNFNFVVPIFDRLFGTTYRGEEARSRQ